MYVIFSEQNKGYRAKRNGLVVFVHNFRNATKYKTYPEAENDLQIGDIIKHKGHAWRNSK